MASDRHIDLCLWPIGAQAVLDIKSSQDAETLLRAPSYCKDCL